MARAKMTSKGQVTVPKEIRDKLGMRPGDELEFVEEDGVVRIKKQVRGNPFAKWEGYAKHLAGMDPDELVRDMRGP